MSAKLTIDGREVMLSPAVVCVINEALASAGVRPCFESDGRRPQIVWRTSSELEQTNDNQKPRTAQHEMRQTNDN